MDHLQQLSYMSKLPDNEQVTGLVGQSPLYESLFDSRMRFADVGNLRQAVYYPESGLRTNNCSEVKDSLGLSVTEKLEKMLNVCSAYTEALTYLSDAGLCLGKCLASALPAEPLKTTDSTPSGSAGASPREMAGCFATGWQEVAIMTRKIVSGFHEGVLAALRESVTSDLDVQKNIENDLLTACFLSVVQIHYQFSLSMYDSIVQLLTNHHTPKNTATADAAITPLSSQSESTSSSANRLDAICKDVPASWYDVMAEMQKQLTAFLSDYNRHQVASSTGVGWNRVLTSGANNEESGVKTWQNFSRRPQNEECTSSWYLDSATPEDISMAVAYEMHNASKRGSTDSQKSNTFASNEELEDVIGLLSCQPSNPSSPTSETSVSQCTHPLSCGNVHPRDNSSLWSVANSKPGSFGLESGGRTNNPLTAVEEFGPSWSRNDGNSAGEDIGFLREHSKMDLQQVVGLQPLLDLTTRGNGTAGDEQPQQHAVAVKSTSWPATNCSRSHSFSTSEVLMRTQNNSGNPNFESGNVTGARAKEPKQQQGFFMGLELVGTDLMATVRQRRHSSGESLCKNGRFNSVGSALPGSSVRTKSIDNITSDGKCPRTSTWPLKQLSPRSSFSSSFYFRGVGGGGDDDDNHNQSRSSSMKQQDPDNCHAWSSTNSDYPPGLPPSGAENRGKKIERKYSLFGNA